MKNLFVGNLPSDATEEALRDLFSPFGEVQQVRIMTDRDTGRARGFAFVEMAEDAAAKAIAALNGKDFGGQALTINEARPKPERGGGGGGGKQRGSRNNYPGTRSPREPRW